MCARTNEQVHVHAQGRARSHVCSTPAEHACPCKNYGELTAPRKYSWTERKSRQTTMHLDLYSDIHVFLHLLLFVNFLRRGARRVASFIMIHSTCRFLAACNNSRCSSAGETVSSQVIFLDEEAFFQNGGSRFLRH